MDYKGLKTKLATDERFSGKSDAECVTIMNTTMIQVEAGIISKSDFVARARSPLKALYALEKTDSNNELYVGMYPMLRILSQSDTIDTSLDDCIQALTVCVAAEIMTEEEMVATLHNTISEAERDYGGLLTTDDIHNAKVGTW